MAVIYILDTDHGTKVGMSSGDGFTRVSSYKSGFGYTPRLVRLFTFETGREARAVEYLTHRILRDDRQEGEWFWCHPIDAIAAVHRAWRAHKIIESNRLRDPDDPLDVVVPDKRPLRISPPRTAQKDSKQAKKPLKAYCAHRAPREQFTHFGGL